ncbi:MAG: class I SAM-dependent methyltransferase, partial [Lysobacterales bacterium]
MARASRLGWACAELRQRCDPALARVPSLASSQGHRTTRDEQSLRARARELASVPWHHSIRLFPDLVINGSKSPELLERECSAILGTIALEGRSVLDIGSWNGYFAFEAKRAGAARVIASDSLCWHLPLFRGRETFDLARECLDLDIETKVIGPTELPGDLTPVDVVLFLGVFYHMHDPIAVLKNAANVVRDVLVIETHQDLLSLDRPGMAFYPRDTLSGDHSKLVGTEPGMRVRAAREHWLAARVLPAPSGGRPVSRYLSRIPFGGSGESMLQGRGGQCVDFRPELATRP